MSVRSHLQPVSEYAVPAVGVFQTGDPVQGEFHCCDCDYGIVVLQALPQCPMCQGKEWAADPWAVLTGPIARRK